MLQHSSKAAAEAAYSCCCCWCSCGWLVVCLERLISLWRNRIDSRTQRIASISLSRVSIFYSTYCDVRIFYTGRAHGTYLAVICSECGRVKNNMVISGPLLSESLVLQRLFSKFWKNWKYRIKIRRRRVLSQIMQFFSGKNTMMSGKVQFHIFGIDICKNWMLSQKIICAQKITWKLWK